MVPLKKSFYGMVSPPLLLLVMMHDSLYIKNINGREDAHSKLYIIQYVVKFIMKTEDVSKSKKIKNT